MNKYVVVTFLVLACVLFSSVAIHPAYPTSSATIFIKPDGSIQPSTAPIQRSGETYTLTQNINRQIVLETNNIILDGSGYMLQGSGGGVAINMTCSNVTVQNLKMVNWAAGVLGVFNNNTVKNCLITQCDSGFKIYAKYYVVLGNDIERNTEGIRIGLGGYNFIAGNNITNNNVGLYLFDSNNEIVQNNIANCSQSAIIQDNIGWSQTVYHNNFVNNQKDLIDYTYSNSINRPLQSALAPWDNGSTGNYWSSYPGADINGDGIGDTPYEIPTYFASNTSGLYSYVDRYPLTAPFNIETAAIQIPTSLTPAATPQPPSSADNQAIALSFLKNVIQLDLSKYKATVTSDSVSPLDTGIPAEYLHYSLSYFHIGSERTASASITVSNNTVTSFTLMATGGQLLLTYPTSNNFDTATRIMQNYHNWTNDADVNKMVTLLNMAGSEKNATELLDNLDLKTLTTPQYTSFDWSYTYNGADYSGVNLVLENMYGLPYITFSDNRGIYAIGNTDISVSKQQAVVIAENYVKSFAYPINFGNGTVVIVRNLGVNESNIQATLATSLHDQTTLYPYWSVKVGLDHIYPGETQDILVKIWADNGAVFQATREVSPIPFTNLVGQLFGQPLTWILPLMIFAIVVPLVVLAIVLIIIFRSDKQKPPQNNQHFT